MTEDELINDTYDNRQRLVQKLNSIDAQSGKPSARIQSGRSKASHRNGTGNGNNGPSQREEEPNPYMNKQLTISGYLHSNNDKPIGSSRQEKSKIVELINSSRTSNKKKDRSSDSQDNNNNNNINNNNNQITKVGDIRIEFADSGKNGDNLDSQQLKNLMQFGDTKEPDENTNQYVIDSHDSNDPQLQLKKPSTGQELMIINQAAVAKGASSDS